jgi:DNA-binding CsgD family transcriptional regulator
MVGGDGVRGRDSETSLILQMLLRGRVGSGGVILVEGEAGMGKSLLLAEAAKAATAQGYATVVAAADEFERMIPLFPLLLALGDPGYAGEPGEGARTAAAEPDARMRGVARVRGSLERLAAAGPVLVTVDDLQYADPVTLLALRVLPRQLAALPVSWVLARSTDTESDAAQLFDLLDHEGADRLPLRPLPEAAIAEVLADLLGVPPDGSLLALAAGAGGNPYLVGELVRGLREENMLRTSAAGTAAVPDRLPERVRKFFRHQIGSLQPQTRQLIEVSAVLGRSFGVEDVAEMLGEPPAMVLPAISEALAAGILAPAGETLTFRDSMTWRAVAEAMPDSLSRALHHQAGQLLLDRGDAVHAAGHLVKGARQGDSRALLELDQAMRTVLPADARTAADLATRALELTSPDDPARPQRAVAAVNALLAARRPREAGTLVETTLGWPLPAAARARLRCARLSVLTLSGWPALARVEAEELLAEPDLPPSVRDDATVALLAALGELPDLAAAEQRARGVGRLASRLRGADRPSGAVMAAARTLQATVKWNRGHIAAALDLLREAAAGGPADHGHGGGANGGADASGALGADGTGAGGRRPYRPVLTLAAHLIDVRLVDEAAALLAAPCDDDDGASLALAEAGPALLRARMHLAAGRIEPAAAEAEAALGNDRAAGFPHAMLARCMLGAIALRRGDLSAAGQTLDWALPRLADAGSGQAGVLCQVLTAQVAEARDGPAAAMSVIGGIYDLIGDVRWPLLHDPGMPPWLARIALAVGDKKRAARVAAAAADLARLNQAFPVVTAACAHVQGLLKSDAGALTVAARTQPDRWASASAAADLAALLVDTGRVPEAIEWLDHAYDGFLASAASRDADRVRGVLRGLGVRRRRWRPPDRQAMPGGLDSLSEAELGIAQLVCQGLTNRQVAERTFVSPNTVAFHLRNIYRKLRVTSRVQLARVMLEASGPPAP